MSALPLDPYFLGAWFGDGIKTTRKHGLAKVAISKPDREIKALCKKTAQEWGLTVRTEHSRNSPTYNLSSGRLHNRNHCADNTNRLLRTLRDLVGPAVTVPKQYLCASRAAQLQFLAGFLDTDGELAHGGRRFVLTQKREDWARAVAQVARSLGLCVKARRRTAGYRRSDGSYFEGVYQVVDIAGDITQIPTRILRKQVPLAIRKAIRKTRGSCSRTGCSCKEPRP